MATTHQGRLIREQPAQQSNAVFRIASFALLIMATLWLSFLTAGDNTLGIDVSITKYLQGYSSRATEAIADFGNAFGTAKVGVPLGIVFALILFLRRHPWGGALVLTATALRVANYGLKALFDSPRPTSNLVRVDSTRDSNGFPSGHAQGATLLCGALLIALWPSLNRRQRLEASVVFSAIVLATGYARISVGAHWPTDVLGGILWGVVLLTIASLAINRLRTRRR